MSTQAPIRVMIVDDHGMVRRGLATILKVRSDMQLVGEAGNGQEALDRCEEAQPDVILMDLVMPEMSGPEATRAIRERCPNVQVIALTSFQERELVREALQAGAISYLLKNVSAEDLAAAIREAHAGRSTLAPEAIQVLIQMEIAACLVVSRSTAKAHVSNILSKLGVSNRAEAIAMALQHNVGKDARSSRISARPED
jgi:NarL family two-component system response regulator LiaR